MKFTPKLPHTVPESLKIVKPDPGPLVKARTHERKAEQIRDERRKHESDPEAEGEGPRPHLEFMERWKALEFAVGPTEDRARHEYRNKLAVEPREHEIIG